MANSQYYEECIQNMNAYVREISRISNMSTRFIKHQFLVSIIKNSETDDLSILNRFEIDYDRNEIFNIIVISGRLEILKYAYENGYLWDSDSCSIAAFHEKLEILRYLHEIGCPWDWTVCMYAAANGNLEMLKYAIDNGCPWPKDKWTHLHAVENGHLHIIRYMCEELGYRMDMDVGVDAIKNDKIDILLYVIQCGYSMESIIQEYKYFENRQ